MVGTTFLRSRSATIGLGFCLALLLLWPGVANRGVFLFPDTSTYIRGADAAVYKLTGHASEWTNEFIRKYPHLSQRKPHAGELSVVPPSSIEDGIVLAGRSIYYGAALFLADLAGSLALMAMLQAAILAAVMLRAAQWMSGLGRSGFNPAWLLPLPLVSAAGFFTCLMMPDLFAAMSIVSCGMVTMFWRKMVRGERILWFAVLGFSLLSHSSHTLIVAATTVFLAGLRWWKRVPVSLTPVVGALLVALTGEVGFAVAVDKATGHMPVRPPFISARLIEDGPGYDYLRVKCAQAPVYTTCAYLDRMPAPSDEFLWSSTTGGVFSTIPASQQRRMAQEEIEFALSTFWFDPLGVIASTLRSAGKQMPLAGLMEFNSQHVNVAKLPDRIARTYLQSVAARGALPVETIANWFLICRIVLIVVVAVLLWRRRRDREWFTTNASITAIVLFGIAADVLICGGISTPHDRYLARVLWLIPFLALAMLGAARPTKSTEQEISCSEAMTELMAGGGAVLRARRL